MQPRRTSIAFTLTLALVGATTLLLGLFGYFSYRANYLEEWADLRREHANLTDQLTVALALPAWNFDRDQIDRVLDGAMEDKAVAGVVVHLADRNSTVHARARDQQWRGVRAPESRLAGPDLLVETRPIATGRETLGTLQVFVTPRFVTERLGQIRNQMIGVVVIVDAILVLSLYFLLWRIVLKPLQQVELFAAAVSSGGRQSAPLGEKQFSGELESVRASLDRMVGQLEARYADLQKSSEALSTSEARLRAVGDNLPDGMIYQLVRETDGTRRFLCVSAGIERINGLAAAEVLRDATLFFEQVIPEDRAKVAAAEIDSLATMTVFDVVVRIRRAGDGAIRWVRQSSAPRRLADGRIVWDGIELDITAQHEAAEALEQSERRFRSAMHNSAIGMGLLAPDGRWLEVNSALCRIVGYSRQELLATNFQAITHPDDLAFNLERSSQMLAGELTSYELEKRYVHKDGHVVWIQVNVSLVRDAQDRPAYFISQIQDITEKKKIAASLADSAERLTLALKASKLGVKRFDILTGREEWDARMYEIVGLKTDERPASFELLREFVVNEDRDVVDRSWGFERTGRQVGKTNFRIKRVDGEVRHCVGHGVVHCSDQGRAEWAIGVVEDITEIVQAAAEAERLRDQLLQAQKMETLGTLAAGIAHDFNNLLTGINGFVELAASTLPEGHEAGEMLSQARRGGMNARDLVRRILAFSRRSRDSRRTAVNIGEVVRDTASLISAVIPSNVTVDLDLAPDLPLVLADAGQVQQVLMNLCTNGAHAIGAAAGHLYIGVQAYDFDGSGPPPPRGCRPGSYVRLAVADTGCGMDALTLARIFEPFFTTKKLGEGTGLGLSVVSDIIASHKGGLEVTSAVGQGTTFTLYLPVAVRELAAVAPPVPEAVGRAAGQRILVVDDEPTVAAVVRLALQRGGYAPVVFTSAEDAWTRFAQMPAEFDLLMVDQQMPAISGPDFIARARQIAPTLPVIMMSGRFETGVTNAVFPGKDVALMKKPFEIAEMLRQVKSVLEEKSQSAG